jgi:hypothetical protein
VKTFVLHHTVGLGFFKAALNIKTTTTSRLIHAELFDVLI